MQRARALLSSTRSLTPASLLKTVRNDPGMTANYYANRYFGKEATMAVNHVLWSQLKRHGKVTIDRSDGAEKPPRWYPTFGNPKRHGVQWHNPEDEDLSILREMEAQQAEAAADRAVPDAAPQASSSGGTEGDATGKAADTLRLETLVLHLVQKEPGRDIQYYIGQLPFELRTGAPLAFKHLRESGLLTRETTPLGTFVWR